MAGVHLICGKIGSGKSWFAKGLSRQSRAVILNCDEIMTLFPPLDGNEAFSQVSAKVKEFLHGKAEEIIRCGTDVILDWGFWKKEERASVTQRYEAQGISVFWYYLNPPQDEWLSNIQTRNAHPGPHDYYVDEGLLSKCQAAFEAPEGPEIQALSMAVIQGKKDLFNAVHR